MNKVTIVGNLGQDPEHRYTNNGTSVCELRVATSERRKEETHTEWHTVKVWGKAADACAKFLGKGSKVAVSGKLETRSWEHEGRTHYRTEIVADMYGGVEFLDKKGDRDQGGQRQQGDWGNSDGWGKNPDQGDVPF